MSSVLGFTQGVTANATPFFLPTAPNFPDAPCHVKNGMADEFFPESKKQMLAVLPALRKICGECTYKVECLEYAVTNNEKDGIWAGTTPFQRYQLRKERGVLTVHERKNNIANGAREHAMRLEGNTWPSIATTFNITWAAAQRRVTRYRRNHPDWKVKVTRAAS
jgi:hypothetical protein